jgi:hypothetical protein
MQYNLPALALLGALALTTTASAQIVNGGATPNAEAPIGTKGGGGSSTIQAPGEGPAVTGAMKNNAQANAMGATTGGTMTHKRHRKATTSDSSMTPSDH